MSRVRSEAEKRQHTIYMRTYRKTKKYLEAQGKFRKSWRINNREHDRAHKAVYKAVQLGKLIKPSECSKCHKECSPEGHHKDYDKKLDVDWLCGDCHRATHKALKEIE